MRASFLLIVLVAACGPSVTNSDDDDDDGGPGPDGPGGMCTNGVTRCSGNTLQTCVGGAFEDTQTCPMVCDDTLGCVLCDPGTGTCEGSVSTVCRPTAWATSTTCATRSRA
jgi:hypothetical protein